MVMARGKQKKVWTAEVLAVMILKGGARACLRVVRLKHHCS